MGTSTSRRSPSGDIRWRAARTALVHASAERAAEQLLAAASADLWPAMMRSEALRVLAHAASDALRDLPNLAGAEQSHAALIRDLVEVARDRAVAAGDGGLVVALGERSMSRLLQQQAQGEQDSFGRGAAAAFFTETVRQLLLHLAARDLPAADPSLGARAARERTRQISVAGDALLSSAQALLESGGPGAWAAAVDQLFGPPAPAPPRG